MAKRLNATIFNGDVIRSNISRDLTFSLQDRIEQAKRIASLCDQVAESGHISIADFVCPTEETRKVFNAQFIVFVDRIKSSRFDDTNKIFTSPREFNIRVTSEGTPEYWVEKIIKSLQKRAQR